jgi:hypothetical protein
MTAVGSGKRHAAVIAWRSEVAANGEAKKNEDEGSDGRFDMGISLARHRQ